QSAIQALGNIGPDAREAVGKIIDAARGAAAPLKAVCLRSLVSIGTTPASAAALAGPLLEDADLNLRQAAIELLVKADPANKGLMPVLLAQLKDPNHSYFALGQVGRLGRNGAKAVPALIDVLKQPNDYNSRLAADALGQIGTPGKPATADLLAMLQRTDSSLQYSALNALKGV